ncbi:hypothetical protein K445DRAFT_25845 [Daldinia sp. EC12]|nr:hypothetical protein K445DRAFT_25845 [Daldinia sp. EC12]
MDHKESDLIEQATDPSPADEGAWILRQPWRPKPPFDRLQIGGSGRMTKLDRNKLNDLVKAIREETPVQEAEQNNDNAKIKFVARGHTDAVRYAVHAATTQFPPTSSRLVMFTDASFRHKHNIAGCGITYKRTYSQDHDWVDAAYGSKGISDFPDPEAIALHRGLWIAYYEIMDWIGRDPSPACGRRTTPPKVIIITDGFSSIRDLHYSYCRTKMEFKPPNEPAIYEHFVCPLDKLVNLGSRVEVHWTPGHVGVEGNCRADALATLGADYAVAYTRETGLDITDLMLPFSDPLQGTNARGAYPFHLGSPMNDFMHWRKEDTKGAIKGAIPGLFTLDYIPNSSHTRGFKKGVISRPKAVKIVVEKKVIKKASKKASKKKSSKKSPEKSKVVQKKLSGIMDKLGGLFRRAPPPPKDTENDGTGRTKRKAGDDVDDMAPEFKRHKTDANGDDQSCIVQ